MDRDEFLKEVWKYAKIIGVNPKEIHIKEMKKKWGSCSSKGRITFNSNLLKSDSNKIKEVIIHELLHLKYHRHDKVFYELLKIYMEME
ncbi:MAG: M48 family metallopeptidase [Minisyncoccia bacterium]|uniref:M48 metallopeptidase family protein n=1 Tax=Caldisericum sp. TaxID=2499687 RepID=UPI003CC42626